MLKPADDLRKPDPYFTGAAGFVGSTLEQLHDDMRVLELPQGVPDPVRRCHDAVRHAYVYSFYSYDLLTLAAAHTFPCLELALREKIGSQFERRRDRKGRSRPPTLDELLKAAKSQGLIASDVEGLSRVRNMFAHGTDAVLNPPLFIASFQVVTWIITGLFTEGDAAGSIVAQVMPPIS